MKIKSLLLGLILLSFSPIQGEPFSITAIALGILTKLGLVTTVGGTVSVGTGAAVGGAVAGATAAGATAGATVATASTVLTTNGIVALTAVTAGSIGGAAGYALRSYKQNTYDNLPENNQRKINALDHNALKQQLDDLTLRYENLEKKYEALKGEKTKQTALIEEMNQTGNAYAALLRQHNIDVTALTEKQHAVYRKMQAHNSMHAPEKVRANA